MYVASGSISFASLLATSSDIEQVSFKKEVGVRVNDLVFWLTLWLNLKIYDWLLSDMWLYDRSVPC